MFKEILAKIINIDVSALSNTELLNFIISISSLAVAVLSFFVSMVALVYGGYQFFLKIGTGFYGSCQLSQSVWSKQRYVSGVLIENRKDKSVAISYIYLKVRSNIYLELVDYERSPRLIAPFETVKIDMDEGVSGYISSTYKVSLDALFANRKVKKRLVVATPQGLAKVKPYKKFWNVYFESLKNFFIIPVRPVKKYYAGRNYSDSLQYVVVEKTDKDDVVVEHFLYRGREYSINGVSVVVDSFKSAEEMEVFLRITAQLYLEPIRVERVGYNFHDFESYESVDIPSSGFWMTHIVGRAYTKFNSFDLALKNKIRTYRRRREAARNRPDR